MNQLSLLSPFGPEPANANDTIVGGTRPYQAQRIEQAVSFIRAGKSPLIEMATGTGKTRTAAETIKALSGLRHLWLAHRIELCNQAREAIESVTGHRVGLEMPDQYSSGQMVVVASKDTLRTRKRLERLKNLDWQPDVIWIDECQHAPNDGYQTILDAFPKAVRAGLSATPDRLDRKPLACFDAACTPYGIVEAVSDSWLVPIKARRVKVKSIDLSHIKTVGGDLAKDELEAIVKSEESIHGAVQGILDYAHGRPSIVFCPGIDSAKRTAEVLDRHKPGNTRLLTGTTPGDERSRIIAGFGTGYQYLVNVLVATEGTDLPAAACIAILRPTKSRALFVQMLGRGLRPLPGLTGEDTNARSEWIRQSPKPHCLVLDFVGVSGRHSVVTAADIGAGETVVRERVRKQIESGTGEIDVFQAIEREQAKEEQIQKRREERKRRELEQRKDIIAKVTVEAVEAALIGMGGTQLDDALELNNAASPGQVQEMIRLGIQVKPGMSRREARFVIGEARIKAGLATGPQLDLIRKHRPQLATPSLTKAVATRIIIDLKRRWRNSQYWRKAA